MNSRKIYVTISFLFLVFLISNMNNVNAAKQDDNEGHTFDFSPYYYTIQPSFYNTRVPYGGGTVIPGMKLTSYFKVDQEFQDYFSKWWRVTAEYVHEIEERKIGGSTSHYFTYYGDFYTTNVGGYTWVEFEIDPDTPDPEWEFHVFNPDGNLQPETLYYVYSYWTGMNPLEVGTYSNSHWLTSEVDGVIGGAWDYDHLLRRTFTFTIHPHQGGGGGGGFSSVSNSDTEIQSESLPIPLCSLNSEYITDIQIPQTNLLITIKQISDKAFKIITRYGFQSDQERINFNDLCLNKLNEKMEESPSARMLALLKLDESLTINDMIDLANKNDWKINALKLKYKGEKGDSYIHFSLFNNKIPEHIFKIMNIDTKKIKGIYGIEVESSVEILYNYIQNNSNTIKIYNLASLFAEEWLENNGYTPEIFTHIGCYG